jgi:hypothetical protein
MHLLARNNVFFTLFTGAFTKKPLKYIFKDQIFLNCEASIEKVSVVEPEPQGSATFSMLDKELELHQNV